MNFSRLARHFVAVVTFFAISGTVAVSQSQNEKMILVLDASGSMWGQIDGVNKIVIAKQAVNDLLDTLPASQSVGLSAYGHREKGSCTDIELLVPPAPNSIDAIRAAVDAISPKGKTPLSAAVLAAAKELRYEEDAATVILISDGRETCDLDPCAIGAELEATGVGFTAHVIGFDVTEAEDKAQLACLAEETGGRFLSASNATELVAALEEVAEIKPEPEPEPAVVQADILLEATDGPDGALISNGLVWWLEPAAEGGTSLNNFEIGAVRMTAKPGAYTVRVARPATADTTEMTVEVVAGAENHFVLAVGAGQPDATVSAPATAKLGSEILVNWTGPDAQSDYISVAAIDARGNQYENYTRTSDGSPLKLRMPSKVGTYEIRYVLNKDSVVLATQTIEIEPVEVSVTAPERAALGSTVLVEWVGPSEQSDYISVAKLDARGNQYENYTRTSEGSPLQLLMPSEVGEYEIRYILNQNATVLATQAITVEEVQVFIDAPATATVGSTVVVDWVGPDAQSDYISVAKLDARGNQYENYTRTSEGTPLKLLMPSTPGEYEIRYILNQDGQILERSAITVAAAEVSLSAPATATVGSTIVVEWTGPDAQSDYISVAKLDARGNQYENYTRTSDGNPLELRMPAEPGEYEVRYVLNQDGQVLASSPISIEAAEVSVTAPATAAAGSSVIVEWVGPDAQSDYISVAAVGSDGSNYENYTRTSDGSPLTLVMPSKPGDYEIRYVLSQGTTVLATQAISVTAVEASVSVPAEAAAGSRIIVNWEGPGYQQDYITIVPVGAGPEEYTEYVYVRDGSPLTLKTLIEPGAYEVRYILDQDRQVLAAAPITLTEVTASLTAPAEAAPGSTIIIEWEGPGYERDFITVVAVGSPDGAYTDYEYAPKGSPLTLTVPDAPGAYEVRYVNEGSSKVLARRPITLK